MVSASISVITEDVLADGGEMGVGGETDEHKEGEEGDREGDEGEGEREGVEGDGGEGEAEGEDPHRARRRPLRKWVSPDEYQQNL